MKRNDCDVKLVKSMTQTCCALHNLCENHGKTYDNKWNAPVTVAEPVVAESQGVEEEPRDVPGSSALLEKLNKCMTC